MTTTHVTTALSHMECYKCHVMFGMTAAHVQRLRGVGGSFWCPNGHEQCFATTEVQRLTNKLADEEQRRSALQALADRRLETMQALERSNAAQRGVVTRIKNRVHAGVCPHCNRSFAALRRHMAHMHPEEAKKTET